MMKKLLFLCLFTVVCLNSWAKGMVALPTSDQIQKFCVPVKLSIDHDIHLIPYACISDIDDDKGLTVVFGRSLDKAITFKKNDIENWEDIKNTHEKMLAQGVMKISKINANKVVKIKEKIK